jgi:hypothetical protein
VAIFCLLSGAATYTLGAPEGRWNRGLQGVGLHPIPKASARRIKEM